MWVIRIGGSLSSDPRLPQWLDAVARLGGGRCVVVAGGGAFADVAREAQAHWRFDDVAAHNMAVLAMAQTAYLLHGLNPALQLARSDAEIRAALRRGRAALWLPFELLREQPDPIASWDVTSDSYALMLARRLGAERLVVVKACAIDAAAGFDALSAAGVLDRRFPALARDAPLAIELVHAGELERVRQRLIGVVGARA